MLTRRRFLAGVAAGGVAVTLRPAAPKRKRRSVYPTTARGQAVGLHPTPRVQAGAAFQPGAFGPAFA